MKQVHLLLIALAGMPSCQRSIDVESTKASLFDSLQAHVGESFQSHFQVDSLEIRDGFELEYKESWEYIFLEANTSCSYSVVFPPGMDSITSFDSRENGIWHTTYNFPAEWKCNKIRTGSGLAHPSLLHDEGDRELFSQASRLLQELDGGEVQQRESDFLISWTKVNQTAGESSLSGNPLASLLGKAVVKVTLGIDLEQGVLTSFGRYYESGEFLELTFDRFEFFEGGYSKRRSDLASKLNLPNDFVCECVEDEFVEALPERKF